MNRPARWILIAVLASCLPFGQAALADDVNFFYGQKSLGEEFFDNAGVDGQTEFGLTANLEFGWPVALALDLLSSSDDQTDNFVTGPDSWLAYTTEVETLEFDVGVRKFWDWKIEPYIGGGIAYIQLDAKQTESGLLDPGGEFSDTLLDDDDNGLGFWLNAGLIYRLGRKFNLGLDLRYSDSSADLTPAGFTESMKLDSGGTHYGIIIGYHW